MPFPVDEVIEQCQRPSAGIIEAQRFNIAQGHGVAPAVVLHPLKEKSRKVAAWGEAPGFDVVRPDPDEIKAFAKIQEVPTGRKINVVVAARAEHRVSVV